MSKQSFPKMVYSDDNGTRAKHGDYCYSIVADEDELEAALDGGFRLTVLKPEPEPEPEPEPAVKAVKKAAVKKAKPAAKK